MDDLREAVLSGDSGALVLARRSGAASTPVLRDLLGHAESPVRELALLGMMELGSGLALEACLKAALDGHPQVRAAAVKGLSALLDPSRASALLDLYDRSPDAETRRHLALAYGKLEKAPPGPLKERLAKEREDRAIEGLVVAAARLGDKDAQAEFLKRMQAAAGIEGRARFLDHVEYVGAPWVLKALLPLLDDAAPAVRTGADGRGEVPEYLRVRDAAVNLATSISKRKSPFKVEPGLAYGDPETEDVRRFLKGLP
jgi:HEAT repeat protein